jgi:hypothetical protein
VTVSPFWLLEADVLRDESEPLRREVRRQGMSAGLVHYDALASGYLDQVDRHRLVAHDCVIFRGTWPLWRHIQLRWPGWIPGGWFHTENLDCSTYYRHFGHYLLNQKHAILRGAEALETRDAVFEQFGSNGLVFVRPAGCVKLFTGRCVDYDSYPSALAPARYDPETRVVVAEPREIGREWRIIIVNGQPIAASQYLDAGSRSMEQGCPTAVTDFVRTVLAHVCWRPDDAFVMDVCEADEELRVLELNGFSCSGLYHCDLTAVVSAIGDLAARAWRSASPAEHLK